uniref:Uncharacterized protein n=1 Tax=Micrurus spixii TaxID=129469 RepID=A0A2D4N195_9SAUR
MSHVTPLCLSCRGHLPVYFQVQLKVLVIKALHEMGSECLRNNSPPIGSAFSTCSSTGLSDLGNFTTCGLQLLAEEAYYGQVKQFWMAGSTLGEEPLLFETFCHQR